MKSAVEERRRPVKRRRIHPRLTAPGRLGLVLLCAAGAALPALSRDHVRPIRFPTGSSTKVVKGAVIRGDRDVYHLRARAGQRMRVQLRSLERNAAFTLFPPGSRVPVPGTEEWKDAVAWTGRLRRSGVYRIMVSGTRGNATYWLRVSIPPRSERPPR